MTTSFTEQEGVAAAMLERLPDEIRPVCAAAGDALEIAASLEARGISSRVARDRFGLNVFELAETLYAGVRAEQVPMQSARSRPVAGRPRDLLRGAMFVAPAVMFTAVIKGLHLHLPSWTFLLALTAGWACGQAIAAIGSSFAGRNENQDALALWGVVITVAVTIGAAEVASRFRDGGGSSIGMSALVAAYVVACSVLLAKEQIAAMARPLVPATVVALIYLLGWPLTIPVNVVLGVLAAAIVTTVAAALWCTPRQWWRPPGFLVRDAAVGSKYFANGLFCGLATSAIAVLSSNSFGRSSVIPVASYPVLFTLGVMEWQLRSFRARADTALRTTRDTAAFGRAAWHSFLLSMSVYFLAITAVSVAVGETLAYRHAPVPVALLSAEVCLGCTFFTGLVASTCFRIVAVLEAALVALVIYVGLFAYEQASLGAVSLQFASVTCCAALATALVYLVFASRSAIRSSFSYQ